MNLPLTGPITILLLATSFAATAADTLPLLKAGDEFYTNVTVTTVTATDIYFSHSLGMGNAKLKSLNPELQQRFKFDPAKGKAVEERQAASTALFQMSVAAEATDSHGEPVAPKLYAKSFRGGSPPQVLVEKWITAPPPPLEGRFVLLEFWSAWSEPCRRAIPLLNQLQEKFRDRLVVIGLSDELESDIRKLTGPEIKYAIGTDTLGRTKQSVQVAGIPHLMLMDPKGSVRFEGLPDYLTESGLELLIGRYGN